MTIQPPKRAVFIIIKDSCLYVFLLLNVFLFGCMNSKSIHFGVVADVQYADKPTVGKRHYAQSLQKLQACVDDFNRNGPSFVVQLGDFIDGGPNAAKELHEVVAIYNRLSMPHYHVLGNHDFEGICREDTMSILGLTRSWYAFDVHRWRFFVLDTQDRAIKGGWTKASEQYKQSVAMFENLQAAGRPNAKVYNGGFSDEQLQWLDTELADADAQNKPVILFGHLPLMPPDESHTAWNAPEAIAVIEKHPCVKAYFCGHRHSGGYTLHNGIHYVTFEAAVNAADTDGAWATVRLSKDRIVVDGYGAVTNRILDIKK